MDTKSIGIVGAGGFGREVAEMVSRDSAVVRGAGWRVVFVEKDGCEEPINDISVLSEWEFSELKGEKYFNIAIADAAMRRRISERLCAANLQPMTLRAGNSRVDRSAVIGEAAIICDYVCINANATIGRYFHANLYSYVAHDCVIGDFVTFAPSVKCNGRVVIQDNVYVGTGAIIRHGTVDNPIVIGEGAVVGMGAVVTKSVPPNVTVIGNPARQMSAS